MRSTMEDIRKVGANWVSIHPYGWIKKDGSVRFADFDPRTPPEEISCPVKDAHELGLKILIKPHLGYWGSGFRWRGDIRFDTEEQWERFFRDYERWIVHLARACRNADAFVVGTELDSTLHREKEWRRVIAAVRGATDLPLTYAANWTCYRRVPFWNALDAIGVQAYFPLTDAMPATEEKIAAGWKRRMGELRAFSEMEGKPVVFTELGYNRAHDAPVRPWEYRTDGQDAEEMQALCLRLALEAVEEEPCVLGSFLWKWFPNPRPVGRNFQLATPALKAVIRDVWTE